MTEGHDLCDGYTTWDGAYVLGALSREDRREYEEHLAGCEHCRAAVAKLAGLPGLLALVDAETAISLAAQEDPPSTVPPIPERLLPALAGRAEKHRRRGRWWSIGGTLAAAAAAVAIAVPVTASVTGHQQAPAAVVVAQGPLRAQTTDVPIVATFKVQQVDGQTRVEMWCDYPQSDEVYTWNLSLWVVRADGTGSELAEWTARPGQVYTPDGTTAVAADQLKTVQIRNGQGKVLMAADI